jgi:four helix bundle protein
MLDHEKLAAYREALVLLDAADRIIEAAKVRAHLKTQLDRSATSIVLNIAEGAGEFSPPEKVRFYRMARRSTNETAAIIEVVRRRKAASDELLDAGYEACRVVISLLVTMIKTAEARAAAEGRFTSS